MASNPPGARRRSLVRGGLVGLALLVTGVVALGVADYWHETSAPFGDPATTDLHFVQAGTGPRRMLLLHGLAGSGRYWVGRTGALSADHALLIPDLLGFGESPKPRVRYDLDDHLAPLERLVRRRRFDDGRLWVVGHSLGAVVALGLASRRPDWVEGVVLVGLPVFRDDAEARARLGRGSWLLRTMLDGSPALRALHYVRGLYAWPWLGRWVGLPDHVYADAMRHTWGSLDGTLRQTLLATDAPALLRAVRAPVLFVHGQEDPVAPIALAEAVAAVGPTARFVALPGADHDVLLERPEAVWALVRAFARQHAG
jgi:pimeloyl-ACP methyl ester carboxylesterase